MYIEYKHLNGLHDTKFYQLLGVVKRAINIKERFGRENKRKLLEGSVQLVFSNDRAENTLKSLISKDKLASALGFTISRMCLTHKSSLETVNNALVGE